MRSLASHLLAMLAGAFGMALFATDPTDVVRTYYADGQVETETPLDRHGHAHGDRKTFWPSGRLKSVVHMWRGGMGRGVVYLDDEPDETESD